MACYVVVDFGKVLVPLYELYTVCTKDDYRAWVCICVERGRDQPRQRMNLCRHGAQMWKEIV